MDDEESKIIHEVMLPTWIGGVIAKSNIEKALTLIENFEKLRDEEKEDVQKEGFDLVTRTGRWYKTQGWRSPAKEFWSNDDEPDWKRIDEEPHVSSPRDMRVLIRQIKEVLER